MPHLNQSFHGDSGDEGCLSNGSKGSANGSKVWGNSVLSANHETPIDNCIEPSDEDLMEIRQYAANTEIKQFLRKNNLEAFESLL